MADTIMTIVAWTVIIGVPSTMFIGCVLQIPKYTQRRKQ